MCNQLIVNIKKLTFSFKIENTSTKADPFNFLMQMNENYQSVKEFDMKDFQLELLKNPTL
jgi:hypothetical protein